MSQMFELLRRNYRQDQTDQDHYEMVVGRKPSVLARRSIYDLETYLIHLGYMAESERVQFDDLADAEDLNV